MKLCDRIYLCGSGAFGISEAGDCHCYVLDAGTALVLIDCGLSPDPSAILEEMTVDGLDVKKLKYVLLTHAHPDHAGGCAWLQEHTAAQIICSYDEARMLCDGHINCLGVSPEQVSLREFVTQKKTTADRILCDQEVLELGNLKILCIHTPGHTAGSTCFLTEIAGKNMLFTGDEVFYKGFISVLSPPFSDYEHYRDGILKLKGRNVSGLFPGHLMWTLKNGQEHLDIAIHQFLEYQRPENKPFS